VALCLWLGNYGVALSMGKRAHQHYSNRDDFSFWSLLILHYYSPWADFSSKVFPHLFNGSLASKIFYSKNKGYIGG
jgi:hypothetical protein